jgi:hypothetical protein
MKMDRRSQVSGPEYDSWPSNNEVQYDQYDQGQEEPDSVLGYLFKEAVDQLTGPKKQAAKRRNDSPIKETSIENNKVESSEVSDDELDKPGLMSVIQEKIFNTDPSGILPDDPVFQFIVGFSALALLFQNFVTPFGKMTVTNANVKKRSADDDQNDKSDLW